MWMVETQIMSIYVVIHDMFRHFLKYGNVYVTSRKLHFIITFGAVGNILMDFCKYS